MLNFAFLLEPGTTSCLYKADLLRLLWFDAQNLYHLKTLMFGDVHPFLACLVHDSDD